MNPMPRKFISFLLIFVIPSAIFLLVYPIALTSLAHPSGTTPGPYLALAIKAPLTPSLTPTQTSTPPYGILLISEVMVRPAGSEPDGEWVELYNSAGATINLSLYKLGDEETSGQGEGMLQFPTGASLAPGQVIIIANKAANFQAAYGFKPDYEMTASNPSVPDMLKYHSWASGNVSLVNTGDEVLVLDGADNVVDSLSWGDSSWAFYPACPAPSPAWTLERYPAYLDTDTSTDWRQQPSPAPGVVDLTPPTSTPTLTPTRTASPTATSSPTITHTPSLTHSQTGTPTHTPVYTPTPIPTQTTIHTFTPAVTPTPTETIEPTLTLTPTKTPTPTDGWLLISEVLYDPAGTEPDSEWIELYNAGGAAIDLSNYKVGDEIAPSGSEGMYQFPISATIDSGQVIIIADRADVFTNTYGFYPDYELIESDANVPNLSKYMYWAWGVVNLGNPGDEVLVLDGSDNFVDAVSWGDSDWAFNPACPVVAKSHSIERNPANVDTDTAADWIDQPLPNPGQVSVSYPRRGK